MSSKNIFDFFTKFGPVEFAKVHDHKYVISRFAFVTFESRETRQTVLNAGEADLTLRGGKKLKVAAARRKETWVRSSMPTEEGASAGYQQYQLPLSDLHYIMPAPHSQSIPFNIISTEQQQVIYNNNSGEQQVFYNNNSGEQQVIYNNISTGTEEQMIYNNNNSGEQQMIYNYYLPNHNYLTNPVAYYYPSAGMMFPHYQQQFLQ